MAPSDADLGELLAQVLPAGVKLSVRHISSSSTPCTALFAAPPGEQPEATSSTNHFLSVSIHKDDPTNGPEIIVFGIEVPIYTTAHLTTIFVSKADSTGYIHLLQQSQKTLRVSLLRLISSTFLSFLVRTHQRPGVRLVLSLFARAQNQYLFPGSIHNPHKHVLDDRGLIKWWCRVADPLLREYESESAARDKGLLDRAMESSRGSATAFLIVPGCDRFETRGFYPPSATTAAATAAVAKDGDGGNVRDRPRWVNSYPVRQLCDNLDAPPRCLIPRLPDDPKTRFLADLDDELPQAEEQQQRTEAATKASGQWRSVRSLEQFWEMMAFRQECSAGRLVGFLWVVINPVGLENSVQMGNSKDVAGFEEQSLSNEDTTSAAPPLHWPETGRGDAVLSEGDYKTALDFLLTQDFDSEEASITSTKEWAEKLGSLTGQLSVGKRVEGRATVTSESVPQASSTNQLLGSGFVRKRKKANSQSQDQEPSQGGNENKTEIGDRAQAASVSEQPKPEVNVLSTNLVRKKKKT